MKTKNILTGIVYLVGIVLIAFFIIGGCSLCTLYWTKLILLALMGIYALINIAGFIFKRKKTADIELNKKKWSIVFELTMEVLFLFVLVYSIVFVNI